jgi:hypothetical protein
MGEVVRKAYGSDVTDEEWEFVPNRRIPEFIDDLQQPSAFVIVVYLDVDFCSVTGDALTQDRANQRIFSIDRIVFLHDAPHYRE